MQYPSYSREYLTELPAKSKREQNQRVVEEIMKSFIQELNKAALSGAKSYMFDMSNVEYVPPSQMTTSNGMQRSPRSYNGIGMVIMQYSIPIDELIALFKERFPGCEVTQKEEWVDTNSNTRTLKKGLCIDWS